MCELQLEGISKAFCAVKALENIDFTAKAGEIHAILGENGAGKSTFIKILSGVLQADKGTIFIDKKKVFIRKPIDAIRAGIGVVFQELSAIGNMTVAQNIFFNNWSKKSDFFIHKKELQKKTLELFHEFEIKNIDPEAILGELSLFQQQIVEIIKVLIRNPKIIIFDEATSALPNNEAQWLLKMMGKLAGNGKIVIFITHKMNEIEQCCDWVTVFRNGKKISTHKVKETSKDELVSEMIGRHLSAYYPEIYSYCQNDIIMSLRNLSVGKRVFDVNFDLYKGEVLGVGGLAGQGQIPLFLALFGILPYKGDIKIQDQLTVINSPSDAIKNGIALVPEDRKEEGLVQTMSIKKNITMSILESISRYGVILKNDEDRRIENAIDSLSIKTSDMNQDIVNLSGGNQQKVLLSKAIQSNPKIFLSLDVTRGVDVGTKVEIFKFIRDMAEKGNTVLYYSTDIDELVNICDRIIVFYNNTVSAVFKSEEFEKEKILKACIGEMNNNVGVSGVETCAQQ